ncbi:MAG: hypothetical protein ACRENE_15780, partial [Polyangiaceae bacterium]
MHRPPPAFVALAALAALPLIAAPARADEMLQRPASLTERAHTMAELEAGIIALPSAPVSAA